MANYHIWLCNDNYTRKAHIHHFTELEYKVCLNNYGYCRMRFASNNPALSDMTVMSRLTIHRDDVLQWSGIVQKVEFTIPATAPDAEIYTIYAFDHGLYADWRTVFPPVGEESSTKTGPADNVAKAYVRDTMGSLAVPERQIADVTVAPDTSLAPVMTYNARFVILQTVLENIERDTGALWRFVPTETGCTFTTWFPIAGLDRRQGNGVNDECVFSLDRRNFEELSYVMDLTGHYNWIHIAGQGEGTERMTAEGEDGVKIDFYKRRERHVDARHIELWETLQDQVPGELWERRPVEEMAVNPLASTWKDPWDLGDLITLRVKRYGSDLTMGGQVVSITITVRDNGTEIVVPTLEKIE